MADKLFSPANREKILRAVVGKPTGVIAEVGGQTFDLVALSAGEVLSVLGLLTKFSDLAAAADGGTLQGPEIMRAIGEDGSIVADLVKSVLKRSAQVTADEEATFEAWFAELPIIETVRNIIPQLLEANGLGGMIQRPPDPPAETPPAEASTTQY